MHGVHPAHPVPGGLVSASGAMSNVIAMPDWNIRKPAGDAHEQNVRAELRHRGWFVSEWGQGVLHPGIRAALKRIRSEFGREPDIVAARGGDTVVGIDCKGTVFGGSNYNINRDSLMALRRWAARNDLPLHLVVDDFNVLTPDEVMAAAGITRLDTAGAYLRVPRGTGRPFDAVFGSRRAADVGRQRLAA